VSLYDEDYFNAYQPDAELVPEVNQPIKELEFSSEGAYSVYNWELFYHVPLTIGIHLSQSGRFQDAQTWFHYVFDPTDDSDGPTPQRFWKVKPFHVLDVKRIEEILMNLSTLEDEDLHRETVSSIMAWKDNPFRPHVIARYRQSAFMWKAVTAYLDNLIEWGDSLFRQDTRESINDAMMLYVLAAQILGRKPQETPAKGTIRPRNYADFKGRLTEFSTAVAELETDLIFEVGPPPTPSPVDDQMAAVASIGRALYFCVPRNDNLLRYWDTVADRLFKIRNSLNIRGIFRQLALFEPPIDPGLLAAAAAAGLDISAVIAGVNQPLPTVRFSFLIQKANELTQEARALGSSLLTAIEKQDSEALAILRAGHEKKMLELAQTVRYSQWQEAVKAREALVQSLDNAALRYTYYERLLGRPQDEIEYPDIDDLDLEGLNTLRFRQSDSEIAPREIPLAIEEVEGRKLSPGEKQELDLKEAAKWVQVSAAAAETIGGILGAIPQLEIAAKPMGAGGGAQFGGRHLQSIASAVASAARGTAQYLLNDAERAARLAGYDRREQDWAFQSNAAGAEMTLLYKQVRAAQIREAIAEHEYRNHLQQIEHADEIEEFLTDARRGKTTNEAFYAWMHREVRGLHSRSFDLAFDTARKAERALQHELGDRRVSYLQFNYLAGKEGLLAGDKLLHDLKRMEMDYHERNRREYELTKDISLLQVDPEALVRLRATGSCEFAIPEALFDIDGPGHYFRRIKAISVSVPAVTGPHTSINCTLTLTRSSIRTDPLTGDGYERDPENDDPRFNDFYGSAESIVTSLGLNDAGLFETNLRDERYLPFEGQGAISRWRLTLPADPSADDDFPTFHYGNIADVVIHMRYTAREGGESLKTAAKAAIAHAIEEGIAEGVGTVRLFDVRHEFPDAWARFLTSEPNANGLFTLDLALRREHYPFWADGFLDEDGPVGGVTLFAAADGPVTVHELDDGSGATDELARADVGALIVGSLANVPLPLATGDVRLVLDRNDLSELLLVVGWANRT
jgi:hypothetical protein